MSELIYVHGYVYTRDRIFVGAVFDDLEEQDVAHALILRRTDGIWDRWDIPIRLAGIACYDGPTARTFIGVGVDGEVHILDADGARFDCIDAGPDSPSALRHLRVVRLIDDFVYAAGMRRQVYRLKLAEKGWNRFDEGILVPLSDPTIAGLWDLHGFSAVHLYAVGLRGEIWRHDHGGWQPCGSPTNAGLYAVVCASDGLVYAAGDRGIVLRGRDDKWEVLANDVTQEAFWSIAEFRGRIYIVTGEQGLYSVQGDAIESVDLPFDRMVTMRRLHTDGAVLLTVGSRDVLLFDGNSWQDLAPPRI